MHHLNVCLFLRGPELPPGFELWPQECCLRQPRGHQLSATWAPLGSSPAAVTALPVPVPVFQPLFPHPGAAGGCCDPRVGKTRCKKSLCQFNCALLYTRGQTSCLLSVFNAPFIWTLLHLFPCLAIQGPLACSHQVPQIVTHIGGYNVVL